ncbi:AAEL013740-PA [Aedes aegypti]|uniref:AAEL013740-PA n=1 Tax=Aedes aegypti TaxID=7159 RepID=Q16IA2_AEDAE|nr:AAEL013740-PA [Aedes aegypti]
MASVFAKTKQIEHGKTGTKQEAASWQFVVIIPDKRSGTRFTCSIGIRLAMKGQRQKASRSCRLETAWNHHQQKTAARVLY